MGPHALRHRHGIVHQWQSIPAERGCGNYPNYTPCSNYVHTTWQRVRVRMQQFGWVVDQMSGGAQQPQVVAAGGAGHVQPGHPLLWPTARSSCANPACAQLAEQRPAGPNAHAIANLRQKHPAAADKDQAGRACVRRFGTGLGSPRIGLCTRFQPPRPRRTQVRRLCWGPQIICRPCGERQGRAGALPALRQAAPAVLAARHTRSTSYSRSCPSTRGTGPQPPGSAPCAT
jgi:hypothetical protein